MNSKKFEMLGVFCTVLGFTIFGLGFWDTMTILWSRQVYSIGKWRNSLPIYAKESVESLSSKLDEYFLQYHLGIAILVIGLIIFLIAVFFSDKEDFSLNTLIISGIITGLSCIIGFWTYETIDQEPVRWFKNTSSLSDLADTWKTSALLTLIVFGLLLLVIIIIGIHKHLQIKTEREKLQLAKEEDTRPLVERALSIMPFYLILAIYLLFTLAPVFITILVSISTSYGINQGDYATKPIESFVLNYSSVLFARSVAEPAFTSAFMNSLILGLGTAGLGIGVSITGGYALARFKFRGNKLATFVILSTQMFPGLILLIPQYLIWKELKLLNREPFTFNFAGFSLDTDISVVVIGVLIAYASGSVAYCTWMLKGYFETIPEEMEEAALIDGCDWFGAFWRIAVPLARPGMVAVALFTFITAWNEFILARTFIREGEPQATLPLLLYNYQDLGAPDVPVYFALLAPYAILIAAPIVIMFMLLQKQLAAGATAGGVK